MASAVTVTPKKQMSHNYYVHVRSDDAVAGEADKGLARIHTRIK